MMTAGRLRLLVIVVIAVGVALRLPAMSVGLGMDDFAQRAMIAGTYPVPRPWWDLFAFTHGGATELRALQDAGSMPWWTHPHLRIAPLRPLASLSVWLDVRVLGDDPLAAHVHSLVWLVAMFAAAAWTLHHALPFRVALVALVLLCLDESHAYPTAWLANRSALMAGAASFLAVGAHLRWRRDGTRYGRWLSPLATLVALACGEYGLGAVAYIVAYEAWGRSGRRIDRVRALAPVALVVVAWAVVYGLAHAGAYGSSIYIDPLREPVAALRAAATRIPALLGGLVLALPTGRWAVDATTARLQLWLGVATIVGLVAWAVRWRPTSIDHPRWWVLGAFGATLPALGGFPSARLVVLGALGIAVVLAHVLVRAFDEVRAQHGPARWAWATVLLGVAFAHGIVAPWWGQQEQSALGVQHRGAEAMVATLPLANDEGEGLRVVVLCASDPMTLLYPPSMREHAGHPRPAAWWVLSMTPGHHELRRVSDRAFELRPLRRAMLRGVFEQLFHRPPPVFAAGTRIELSGLMTQVLETDAEGFPTAVRFTFDRPLEDPSLRFVLATASGYFRYPFGPIGAVTELGSEPPAWPK
jgi:hypothetical protein